jgi:hypothetical protein
MSQPNPVDIEAIRTRAKDEHKRLWEMTSDPSNFWTSALEDTRALCDEVKSLRARVKEIDGKGESVCPWVEDSGPDGDPYYSTSCGGEFIMLEGGLKDNEFKFCAYCGKKIVELAKPVEPTKGETEA